MPKQLFNQPLRVCGLAVCVSLLGCNDDEGESDGLMTANGGSDIQQVGDAGAQAPVANNLPCEQTPWGSSCKVNNQIYDLSFFGLELHTNTERDISFTDIRCAGYKSVVFVGGDTWCSVCPIWYEEIGKHIDEFHDHNAAVVVSSTDQFGSADLTNAEAAESTAAANPDYATGTDPFVYPCKFSFTPFTLVVDLKTGTILGKDTQQGLLNVDDILLMVAAANM